MNIQEAMSVAQQWKNHVKAFEKIDEVIQFLSVAEARTKELEQQRDRLNKEIVSLSEAKAKIETDHNQMVLDTQVKSDEHLTRLTELNERKKTELESRLEQITAEVQAKKDELDTLQIEFENTKKENQNTIELLTDKITSLKSELSGLREKVASL